MLQTGEDLVVGVFTTRAQANAAFEHLHWIGLSDDRLEVRTPETGRYHIEDHAASEIGAAVLTGIIFGGPIGSLIGLALFAWAFPDFPIRGMLLGIMVGSFWGAFYGGVIGMVPKLVAHIDDRRWYDIVDVSQETLVIAWAGGRARDARKVLNDRGACCFLTEIPPRRMAGEMVPIFDRVPLPRSA